jgi:hypothetical protein
VNVHPFIEAEKAQQRNVKRACELLEVSRAAYYAQRPGTPSARQVADAALTEQIRQAHQVSKDRYGAPRLHAALRRAGHHHGRKRVARLMRCAGLRGRTPRRWKKTTVPDPAAAARADLIRRDFTVNATAVNTRWCGDITYLPTWEGWLYLATVIDIASRRVVGFALAEHLRTELVADALTNAVAARDPAPGVVFHADRGCQYTSGDYATLARRPGRHLVERPHRAVLGQRARRVVLRVPERRVPRPAALAHPSGRPPRHRGVHRLVQRHPAAQRPWLHDPRRVRDRHPQGGPHAGSLTEPPALSVKAGQPQGTSGPPAQSHRTGSGSRRRRRMERSTGRSAGQFSWPQSHRPDRLTANATEPPSVRGGLLLAGIGLHAPGRGETRRPRSPSERLLTVALSHDPQSRGEGRESGVGLVQSLF